MFKITKCENCVVCLRFALIAISYIRLDKGHFSLSLFCILVEIAICLHIVYRIWPHSDKLNGKMDIY